MKLLNLKFLNKFCRKHIFSILLGFMTMFKKNTPTIAILAIILSLFGDKILVNCDDNCDDNSNDDDEDNNDDNDDDDDDDSDEDTMMMKSVMQAQGHGTQSVMCKQNMTGTQPDRQ